MWNCEIFEFTYKWNFFFNITTFLILYLCVSATMQSILKHTLTHDAFKKTGSGKHKKKQGFRSRNKKHKSSHKQNFAQQHSSLLLLLIFLLNHKPKNTMPSQPVLSVPSGFASQGQNIQFVAKMSPFSVQSEEDGGIRQWKFH